MTEEDDKEKLYRKLNQTSRLIAQGLDALTRERLLAHLRDLQEELDAIESRDDR